MSIDDLIESELTYFGDRYAGALFGFHGLDGCFRYSLWRRWDDTPGPILLALMLNPSKATHVILDPTVKGMFARAKAWGYVELRVANLYAYRATDPREIFGRSPPPDPIGPLNDVVIREEIRHADIVVCGWGVHARPDRVSQIVQIAADLQMSAKLHALRLNADRSPEHPLYIPRTLLPVPWRPA